MPNPSYGFNDRCPGHPSQPTTAAHAPDSLNHRFPRLGMSQPPLPTPCMAQRPLPTPANESTATAHTSERVNRRRPHLGISQPPMPDTSG